MQFKNDSIIICSAGTKRKLLEKNSGKFPLFYATYFDLKSFKEKYYYKISNKAVIEAMNFLNMSYSNAKIISQYIYFVDENRDDYNDKKLIMLKNLKRQLQSKKLLEYNPIFNKLIEGKDIYVFDLFLDNFYKNMLDKIAETNNVFYVSEKDKNRTYDKTKFYDFSEEDEYVFSDNPDVHMDLKLIKSKKRDVLKFKTYDKEVEYVFTQISKLLVDQKNAEKINSIYIWSNSTTYNHMLSRYSDIFGIPVSIRETESIKNHVTYKEFYKHLSLSHSKTEAIRKIEKYKNTYEYNALISLLNEFYFLDDDKLCEVIKVEIENVKYEDIKYNNCVKVVSNSEGFKEDDHVFLIGFDSNTYPKTYKDDDYLPSSYAEICSITTQKEKNKIELNKAIYTISKINNDNLTMTFSEFSTTKNVISLSSKELNCEEKEYIVEEKTPGTEYHKYIPGLLNQLNRASFIDKQIEQNKYIKELNEYKSYNPKFINFVDKDIENLKEILKDPKVNKPKLHLSYTSMDEYYKCHFRYYLERVLKIKHDEDRVATKLGNIFHGLLEKNDKEKIDLEVEKQKILDTTDDIILKYYFNKFWEDFKLIIDFNTKFKDNTKLKGALAESELIVEFSDENVDKKFTGKIDKIIFKKDENGNDYIAIIDYKTGDPSATLDNIVYGLNLQLPSYAYLISKGTFKIEDKKEKIIIENPIILGLFLQKILQKVEYKLNQTKDPTNEKVKNLKLEGYSISDNSLLGMLEPNYADSDYIKNLKFKSESTDFVKDAKLFSSDDIKMIIDIVDTKIKEAFDSILQADFTINPKKIGSLNVSCQYCPYSNICYVDKGKVKKVKKMEFAELVAANSSEEEVE